MQSLLIGGGGCVDKDKPKMTVSEKRKSDEGEQGKDLKKVRHLIEFINYPSLNLSHIIAFRHPIAYPIFHGRTFAWPIAHNEYVLTKINKL